MGRAARLGFVIAGTLAGTGGCGGATSTGSSRAVDAPPTPISSDGGLDTGSDGGGVVPTVEPRSGTRLTVVPYSSDFPQAWDNQKNLACEPGPAGDGTERCLPVDVSPVFFTDPDCKHPVVQRTLEPDACGNLPTYFVDSGGPSGCLVPKRNFYTAGAEIQTPTTIYNHNAGFCTVYNGIGPAPSGSPFYEAVPSDLAEWVELTEEVVPVTDALAVVNWKGADGSRLSKGLRLRDSDRDCTRYPGILDVPEPPAWCIPTLRATRSNQFGNDQCIGERILASCGPTEVADPAPGIPTPGLFETGAPVSSVYFTNFVEGNKCTLLSPDWKNGSNPTNFYTIGPQLNMDRYPSLDQGVHGSGRIQTEYMTSAGKDLVALSLVDTQYGQRCWPMRLSDGGTWCVPGGVDFYSDYPGYAFADSQCTRRVEETSLPTDMPSFQFRFALVYPPGHSCNRDAVPALYTLAEHRGPTYQEGVDGCAPGYVPQPGSRMYEAGTPINPSGILAPAPPLP